MEQVLEIENPAKPKKRVRVFTVFLIVVLVFSIVMAYNFKIAQVRGESMVPTLKNGQKVLTCHAYWLVGAIKKDDIIVLKEEKSNDYFIKRVIGLPGESIPWSMAPMSWPLDKGKYVVPEGRIYVVGDNLNHSDDSRKFGAFLQSNILGKVLTWQ